LTPKQAVIFVATERLDLRRSFDGLAEVARDVLRKDPQSGALFLFFNRRADRLKLLWWDRNGYCILYKRLEKGSFAPPRGATGLTVVAVDSTELVKILAGEGKPATANVAAE
jgi:transposase